MSDEDCWEVSPPVCDAVLRGGPRDGLQFQTSLNEHGCPSWPGMAYDYPWGKAWYRWSAERPRDIHGRYVFQYTGPEWRPYQRAINRVRLWLTDA